MTMMYLDHNATSPILKTVHQAMVSAPFGNANSVNYTGIKAKIALLISEERIKKEINGHNGRIIWTSGGTQANYIAITGICKDKGDLITSNIEHKSIYNLRRNFGNTLDCLSNGMINLNCGSDITKWKLLKSSTAKLVSLMYVNNETGVIQPVSDVKQLIHPKIKFHIDAVQALGKIKIDIEKLGADLLTLSAHKIGGPQGIGCLWIRNNVDIKLQYLGTPNVAGIVGFGKAIKEISIKEYNDINIKNEYHFLKTLNENKCFYILNTKAHHIAGTLSISFPGIDGSELMYALSDKDIIVSTGSACNSNQEELSYVLLNMGINEKQIKSTIRISMGKDISVNDIIKVANIITMTIKELNYGS